MDLWGLDSGPKTTAQAARRYKGIMLVGFLLTAALVVVAYQNVLRGEDGNLAMITAVLLIPAWMAMLGVARLEFQRLRDREG
jgi:ABC-type microcin C transport system permease subunit YejE